LKEIFLKGREDSKYMENKSLQESRRGISKKSTSECFLWQLGIGEIEW
jgi:hypothetical protein